MAKNAQKKSEPKKDHQNPIPVAVGLIRVLQGNEIKYLGVVRSLDPVGGLAFPSGYVEKGESIEEAVAREVLEETGVSTQASDWRLTHSRTNAGNRALIFCELIPVKTVSQVLPKFVANTETSGTLLLDASSVLCFPLHQEALLKSIQDQRLRSEQSALQERVSQTPRMLEHAPKSD
jgi:8-oxo-dGTP diphosphatase